MLSNVISPQVQINFTENLILNQQHYRLGVSRPITASALSAYNRTYSSTRNFVLVASHLNAVTLADIINNPSHSWYKYVVCGYGKIKSTASSRKLYKLTAAQLNTKHISEFYTSFRSINYYPSLEARLGSTA